MHISQKKCDRNCTFQGILRYWSNIISNHSAWSSSEHQNSQNAADSQTLYADTKQSTLELCIYTSVAALIVPAMCSSFSIQERLVPTQRQDLYQYIVCQVPSGRENNIQSHNKRIIPQFAFVETWHKRLPRLTCLQYSFATRAKGPPHQTTTNEPNNENHKLNSTSIT